jgi:hypothetical protein
MIGAALACLIIVSPGTNGDVSEKYTHELAHCNGWEHPLKPDPNGKAFQPPARFNHPYAGRLIVKRVSTAEAKRLCGGHFACQFFR